eukprot:11539-Eustigmatos_ZCMA.PRE.1
MPDDVLSEIAKDPGYAFMIDELLSGVGSTAEAPERQACMYCTLLLQVYSIPALRLKVGRNAGAVTLKCTEVDEAVSTLDRQCYVHP